MPSAPSPTDELTELRDRAQWYARLLETTRDAVVCIDRDGKIVLFNHAAELMFGYQADELMGEGVERLMTAPYSSEHDEYVKRYERTRQPHAIGRIRAVAARRKNGEVFPIELSVTEVDLGNRARYGAFIRDITEKIGLQERLLERERLAAIGTTAASFAHEIGNPLNGMYTHAQLLERRLAKSPSADPRLSTSVESLMSEMRRLRQLLDEFRALSRRQHLSVLPTDLVALVRDLLRSEQPALSARGIAVVPPVADRVCTSFVDAEKLRQVLLNLIKNASDAMPTGGTLAIRVDDRGTRIGIEVQDSGSGVTGDLDPFEPFVTSKPQGTGLGLPVALQIVQSHGGQLTFRAAEGGGTVFSIELPRRDKADK